ncbi:MAG TPA: hypothetical protein VLF71_01755, partial [Candidatus Saccharimonadales bacterium]|nr:hypothetical protein [Candidatus Saccharimonadales bacterium]
LLRTAALVLVRTRFFADLMMGIRCTFVVTNTYNVPEVKGFVKAAVLLQKVVRYAPRAYAPGLHYA